MTTLNVARQNIALLIGGSLTGSDIPAYFMIGSGSGTVVVTQTALIAPLDRQLFTSTDLTTTYNVTWTGDWNTVEMSGISLTEFGVTYSGTGTTGSMWTRTALPAINFDGTNELRIEETMEVF